MKKSKMFLTGIAVLGIVGSALAFTAKPKAMIFCIRAHIAPASAPCTTQVIGTAGTGTQYYGVERQSAPCTSTTCNSAINFTPVE